MNAAPEHFYVRVQVRRKKEFILSFDERSTRTAVGGTGANEERYNKFIYFPLFNFIIE